MGRAWGVAQHAARRDLLAAMAPLKHAISFGNELDAMIRKGFPFNEIIVPCSFCSPADNAEGTVGGCGEVEEIASRTFNLS